MTTAEQWTSADLAAAADRIRASTHPAAEEIADLLNDAALELGVREQNWTNQEWAPSVQADLTRWLYPRHIALAQKLTQTQVIL
jgi:hypothetical protein